MKYVCLILILFGSFSCSFFKTSNDKEKPIVKVDDNYLYPSDLRGIGRGLSSKDSIRNVEKFVENWIRNEIVLNEATKDSEINKDEVEAKLMKLRRDLYLYEYEKNFLEHNQDTSISQKEIQDFYESNPSNFELKQHIFQGHFVKVDRNSSVYKIKKYMRSKKAEDYKKLEELVTKEADTYHIDTLVWHNLDDISRNTPFEKIPNQEKYLKNTTFDVRYTKNFVYILRILNYKLISEVAPIEFHEKMIRSTLIHKERRRLIQDNEENLYKKAKKEDRFEIYF